MANVYTLSVRWREDAGATVFGRLTARDGTGATQSSGRKLLKVADVSAVTVQCFDRGNDNAVTHSATPTVNTVIFDTLQTDWDGDSTGYNFRADLPASAFPTGGNVYTVEAKVTTSGGTAVWADYTGPAWPVLGS